MASEPDTLEAISQRLAAALGPGFDTSGDSALGRLLIAVAGELLEQRAQYDQRLRELGDRLTLNIEPERRYRERVMRGDPDPLRKEGDA